MYGIRGPTLQNPIVKGFLEVHPQFLDCLDIIGAMPPVDLFPFLMHIPERFAQWKEYPKKIQRLQEQLYDKVLSTVEKQMASGHGIGSLMEDLITKGPSTGIPTREHLMYVYNTSDIYVLTILGILVAHLWRAQIQLLPVSRSLYSR